MPYILKTPDIKYVSTSIENVKEGREKSSVQNKLKIVNENKRLLSLMLDNTRFLIYFLEDKSFEDLKKIGIQVDKSMFDTIEVTEKEYLEFLLANEKMLIEQLGSLISVKRSLTNTLKRLEKKKEEEEPKKDAWA